MRCAATIVVVSIVFVSQGFAVLRPLFPAKTAPPFNGELIVIGNDSIQHPANKARGRESNPRIAVLQTATLPLGYPADIREPTISL